MRLGTRLPLGALLVFFGTVGIVAGSALAQEKPKRLYSNGDSITRAVDAHLPFDNLNLSWVNGYHGFWQRLFHIPNVNAHNQRISKEFGKRGRRNWIAAQNGARVEDLKDQAAGTAGRKVDYATVLLGANDVCRHSLLDPPTGDELAAFETDFRAGMTELLTHLPSGATIYVAAIPDLAQLYEIGQDKAWLGIADCPLVWRIMRLCESILLPPEPYSRDGDLAMLSGMINVYNQILQDVIAELPEDRFVYFTDRSFAEPFTEEHISDIDCFHPSWEGQKFLSELTWEDSTGPNFGD